MILDLVFTILNFLLAVGLCSYLFMKYGKPIILQALLKEEQDKKEKQDAYQKIVSLKQEIQKQREDNKIFFVYLQGKISLWKETKENAAKSFLAQQDALREQIDAKNKHKTMERTLNTLQREAFKAALLGAKEELVCYFDNEQRQNDFLDKSIGQLEKNRIT